MDDPHHGMNDPHHWTFDRVARLAPAAPARIHHYVTPRGHYTLAIDRAGLGEQDDTYGHGHLPEYLDLAPVPVRQRAEVPLTRRHGKYLLSSACLDGAVSLTPSYRWQRVPSMSECVPLQARHAIAPAVLGEFRLDRVGKPIDLSSASTVFLGYRGAT